MLFCFFRLAVEPWAGLGGSKGGGSSKSAAFVIRMGVRNWLSFPWWETVLPHKLLMAKTTLEKRCGNEPSNSE